MHCLLNITDELETHFALSMQRKNNAAANNIYTLALITIDIQQKPQCIQIPHGNKEQIVYLKPMGYFLVCLVFKEMKTDVEVEEQGKAS